MWLVWGRGNVCTGFCYGNLRERDHWGDPDVHGRIILRWILRKWDVVAWTGSIWLSIVIGECVNEPSGCIRCGEFLHG
jgi:hypothetical protein